MDVSEGRVAANIDMTIDAHIDVGLRILHFQVILKKGWVDLDDSSMFRYSSRNQKPKGRWLGEWLGDGWVRE